MNINHENVEIALDLLHKQPGCIEIRLLKVKVSRKSTYQETTYSGYFENTEKAVNGIKEFVKQNPDVFAGGIYTTLNPISTDLLARSFNRIRQAPKGETTSDKDILSRRWLLLDFDYSRPSGISTTDTEKKAAGRKALHILETLQANGWPEPILADSGNGYHLLYQIDLPSDDNGLVKGVLNGLNLRFSNFEPKVKLDVGNFNAARITKLYGTLACKGDNTPERPHRLSCLENVSENLVTVTKKQLESIFIPDEEQAENTFSVYQTHESLEEWASRYQIDLTNAGAWTGGGAQSWNVSCPFNSDHGTYDETQVYEFENGCRGFKCQHESCTNNHWREYRQKVEAIKHPIRPAAQYSTPTPVNSLSVPKEKPKETLDDSYYKIDLDIALKEITNAGPLIPSGHTTLDDAIHGFQRGKFVVINGAPHCGKSSYMTQLLTTMSQDNFVVYYSSDEGHHELLKRLGRFANISNDEMLFNQTLPRLKAGVSKQVNWNNCFLVAKRTPMLTLEELFLLAERQCPPDKQLVILVDSLHSLPIDHYESDNIRLIYSNMAKNTANWVQQKKSLLIGLVEQARGGYASRDPETRTAAMATSAETRAWEFNSDYLFVMNECFENNKEDDDEVMDKDIPIRLTLIKVRGSKKYRCVYTNFNTRTTIHAPLTREAFKDIKKERAKENADRTALKQVEKKEQKTRQAWKAILDFLSYEEADEKFSSIEKLHEHLKETADIDLGIGAFRKLIKEFLKTKTILKDENGNFIIGINMPIEPESEPDNRPIEQILADEDKNY